LKRGKFFIFILFLCFFKAEAGVKAPLFTTFQEDTLDSIILIDTCAQIGDTLFIPVYLRNPVHTVGGFEVYIHTYDHNLLDIGYANAETVWIDTTGSIASHFPYFTPAGGSQHNWVKVVGIYNWLTDTVPPIYPSDTFALLFKVAIVVDTCIVTPYDCDSIPDTLAYLLFNEQQTRLSDTSGLSLWYPGVRESYLVIGNSKFIRGDVNGDSTVNVSDVIYLLNMLFPTPNFFCMDAADCNDDGALNVIDATFLLEHLFPIPSLPPPYPECGYDPTDDNLNCCEYESCWPSIPWFER